MSSQGGPAAWRGFRLQALYTISRFLSVDLGHDLIFYPEDIEDLSIRNSEGHLIELIQVKSYGNLSLSNLHPEKSNSFFHRVLPLLTTPQPPKIKLVNFGNFGEEMRMAWNGEAQYQDRISQKLVEKGFTSEDVNKFFEHIELETQNENEVEQKSFDFIRQTVAGRDPKHTFELFYYWTSIISEQQGYMNTASIIEKLNKIGNYLTAFQNEQRLWFTTIKPINSQPLSDDHKNKLREEFYAGAYANYEHILAELDFPRPEKLETINENFKHENVVLIHAASGQGKSTLAWRYLLEFCPESWRFSIEAIENLQHVLEITHVLSTYADAIQAPMLIYIDVSPRDNNWLELVERLARHPYLHILVTVREEDLRRANVSGATLRHRTLELNFDRSEAQLIYQRAIAIDHNHSFLDFNEAWQRFGETGPLLEFVYFLTATQTLQESLRQQINRIRQEAYQEKADPNTVELLRLISVASAHNARLKADKVIEVLSLRDPYYIFELLEKSYLLRLSDDKMYLDGLHPVRSKIIAQLLTHPNGPFWYNIVDKIMPLIVESDIEIFVLQAFIEQPDYETQILNILQRYKPTSWQGIARILRCLLWIGTRNYAINNLHLVEKARQLFGNGWWFIVDFNLVSETPEKYDEWWKNFDNLITPERQEQFKELRNLQSPKEEAFALAGDWLSTITIEPELPMSTMDWQSVAHVCYWEGHLLSSPRLYNTLPQNILDQVVADLPLSTIADLSFGLHKANPEYCSKWLEQHRPFLEKRLADEYFVVSLQEENETLIIHFLLLPRSKPNEENNERNTSSSIHHLETLERIEMVRRLLPTYKKYGSQGYGHKLSSWNLPLDETTKTGINIEAITPSWVKRINSITIGITNYYLRTETWQDYINYNVRMRNSLVHSLINLRKGLIKYLSGARSINIIERYIDLRKWEECQNMLSEKVLLPQQAVDPWGYSHESIDREQLGPSGFDSRTLISQKYQLYAKAESVFTSSLLNFFKHALHVIWTNFLVGELLESDPKRHSLLKGLKARGINTNLNHTSTVVLRNALNEMPLYQKQFHNLFSNFIAPEGLVKLQDQEFKVLRDIWNLWYFFAYQPREKLVTPIDKMRKEIIRTEREMLDQIQKTLEDFKEQNKGISVVLLSHRDKFLEEPTLWFHIDVLNPLEFYLSIEKLVFFLRQAISKPSFESLRYHWINDNWRYTIIVPTIRGRMLDKQIWRLFTQTTIFGNDEIGEKIWQYRLIEISDEDLERLKIIVWKSEKIEMANQFANSVAELSFLVARLVEFNAVPDVNEAGLDLFRDHIKEQSAEISKHCQIAFDIMGELINEFNELPEEQKPQRSELINVINIMIQLNPLLRPGEGVEDKVEAFIPLEDLAQYAEKLNKAVPLAQALKLYLISDEIDHNLVA